MKVKDLRKLANDIRITTIEMINKSHASHIASAFSMVEILATLYGNVMNISPENCESPDRDRFVLSKGHGASSVYATLYHLGFLTDKEIDGYYTDGSNLSGHVSHKGVKGIEVSTGSLGHGCSMACGLALAGKLNNRDYKTYCIVGDGECNEGSVWETAMFAASQKLSNFTIIIDSNKMQAMGETKNICEMSNMARRWQDFGWQVYEVDGHDIDALTKALTAPKSDKPTCVIANTIKGKGVSFMENNILWHYRDPQGELFDLAYKELKNNEK